MVPESRLSGYRPYSETTKSTILVKSTSSTRRNAWASGILAGGGSVGWSWAECDAYDGWNPNIEGNGVNAVEGLNELLSDANQNTSCQTNR